ncbi:MAG TPA: N-acetylmuramoyl-L-alanine amidase [Candidatus Omnitrophota bacterium]|nr:N-acetylmuramoyl-L-alanine amidase [Candidatus Omnitrophota bacterium]
MRLKNAQRDDCVFLPRAACVALALFAFAGCATAPRTGAVPRVTINGTTYALLAPFCESRSIKHAYDQLTRTITLSSGAHQVVMAVAESTVLVDGSTQRLRHAPDIYNGSLVIPDTFRQQMESLLGNIAPHVAAVVAGFQKIKRISIDAGHGGRDPGALGKRGLREKDLTLDLAKRLAAVLERQGIKTTLVRSSDSYISLDDRVRIANDAQADLFVSIHVNASRNRSVSGFEVYHISNKVSDTDRAMTSLRAGPLPVGGVSFADASSDVKATVWDLIHTYNRGESTELARAICRNIGCSLAAREKGVKTANFCVLRGTAIPGVLVEVGYISNPRESRLLEDGSYRQSLAEGIARGLRDYDRSLVAAPRDGQDQAQYSKSMR